MKNQLIGAVLKSLTTSYENGDCEAMSTEEQNELLQEVAEIRDRMELKQDVTMTTEEVSQFLGVTRQTVRNYVEQDLLHPRKQMGGVLQFRKKEVLELIRKMKQK